MSVIAVGNQIDCTHRPSKFLYSHIQQTSARVPKCFQNIERRNMSYVIIVIRCNYSVGHKHAIAMSKTQSSICHSVVAK